jgi:hypothetical protein
MGLGFLHRFLSSAFVWLVLSGLVSGGFIAVNFTRMGSSAPRPTPNLEYQGLHFVWLLLFDIRSIALQVIGVHRPLHDKVIILEEVPHYILPTFVSLCTGNN